MSVTEWLGYATALLDSLQLRGALIAIMIVTVAYVVYRRFFGGGD